MTVYGMEVVYVVVEVQVINWVVSESFTVVSVIFEVSTVVSRSVVVR
jgi:hypothetical protein